MESTFNDDAAAVSAAADGTVGAAADSAVTEDAAAGKLLVKQQGCQQC